MKSERIVTEIEKTKAKIATLQARLKELEQQKIEADNTSILAVVRSANLTPAQLTSFIQAYAEQGAAAESMLVETPEQEDDTHEDE